MLLCWLETIVIIASAMLAKFIYVDLIIQHEQSILIYLGPASVLAAFQYITFREMRLHDLETIRQPAIGFGAILGGLALSFLILIGVLFLFKGAEFYSRGWFLIWALISSIGIFSVRWVIMKQTLALQQQGRLRQRVALVGTNAYMAELRKQLADTLDYHVVAEFSIDNRDAKEIDEVQSVIGDDQVDCIIIGVPARDGSLIRQAVQQLSAFDREVLLCSSLEEPVTTSQSHITISKLRCDVVNSLPRSSANYALKRAMDCSIASIALLLLLPILVITAVAIRMTSRGPVIFRQRRLGLNNRVFQIYKFRTMTVMENDARIDQARRNDPRVTPVGRWLRASSIDELPQLLNVLKGEMSLVGPRPHAIAHDREFEKKFDLFGRRRRVRPGLTGWAQVNGCRGATPTDKDVRDRMDYDLYYIDNWSIWLDLEILCRTVVTVIRGAY